MKLENVMLNEIRDHKKTNTRFFHLHEVLTAVKFLDTESQMVVASGGGRENGKLVFNW